MTETNVFTMKHNAKRAAERALAKGNAPAAEYTLAACDGGFQIVWAEEEPQPEPALAREEFEIEEEPEEVNPFASIEASESNNRWPDGARVQVGKRKTRVGTIVYRVDDSHWRVHMDRSPEGSTVLYHCKHFLHTDAAEPEPEAPKSRGARVVPLAGKRGKNAELDEAAARGAMPEKPIVTSKANPHYQKRFDKLAELAAAGDWAGVESYKVTGVNSYAKMVRKYQERLLVAHATSVSAEAA